VFYLVVVFFQDRSLRISFMIFKELLMFQSMIVCSTGYSYYLTAVTPSQHLTRSFSGSNFSQTLGSAIGLYLFSNWFSIIFAKGGISSGFGYLKIVAAFSPCILLFGISIILFKIQFRLTKSD
jgi:hypothetical protein